RAGGAAQRHDLALVEQGDRHCARVRARGRAADRARHRVPRTRRPAPGERAPRAPRAGAHRPHDGDGAARWRAGGTPVRAFTAGARYFPDPHGGVYRASTEPIDILMKVETHNHPTAISPFPGAATGAGGEIRDEGATGRGAKPKAGLTGFSVSNLRIPGYERPWEQEFGAPARIASALQIMLEGPIGAASFNNEFGRPAVCGYFRTFEQRAAGDPPERLRGY